MSSRDLRAVQRWASHLVDRTSGLLGVLVENKTHSLSVHYRHSRQKRAARTAILEAIEGLGGVRVVPGKQVVNVLPAGAPHKGVALERLRKSAGCDTALYVGDDETDEDVFALDRPGQLLAIRVGRSRTSKAGHFIESQARIDDLLAELARLASVKDVVPRERRRA